MNITPEYFYRTEILLGKEGLTNLSNKHVLIAGIGGVGGYVVENIVRAGVGKVTVIDNDVVDITNINRQIIALQQNIGKSKVIEFSQRIREINPKINLISQELFIEPDNIIEILADTPDYVIDCIDTVQSKLALLEYCMRNKIKVISSMGAGNRVDVTKVKIADISKTKICALARNIRLKLRERGLSNGLRVVYSEEQAYAKPLTNPNGGRLINGTISYLPALFGIMLSGLVIKDLINAK